MESTDDDFGDIYSDVEAQAISAVNGVPGLSRLYIEPEADDKKQDANNQRTCFGDGGSSRDLNCLNSDVGDGHPLYSEGALNEKLSATETDGSDSEDDLNIVLNDNDHEAFSSKTDATLKNGRAVSGSDDGEDDGGDAHFGLEQDYGGLKSGRVNAGNGSCHSQYSQYKYIRPSVAICSNIAKDNGTDEGAPFFPMFARDGVEENKHSQEKRFSSGQVVGLHSTFISGASLSGYSFSLPCYRTILDVNIDSFEYKPWRNPGADITKFFNFDFDEESWRSFCKSLDLIRQQTSRIPVHDLKSYQGYETQFDSEKVAQEGAAADVVGPGPCCIVSHDSVSADRENRQPGKPPKGRAIHVEDSSNCERLPYVKRPSRRDSNVVIEIVAKDSIKPYSSSQKWGGYDSDITGYGTSRIGDLDVNGNMDIVDGDVRSLESLDGEPRKLGSKRNYVESGYDQKYIMDGLRCCQKNVCSSSYSAGAVEKASKKDKEISETSFGAGLNTIQTNSSNDNEIEGRQSSANLETSSYSSGFHDDPDEHWCSMKKASSKLLIDTQNSLTPTFYRTEDKNSNGFMMKTYDSEDSPQNISNIHLLSNRVGSLIIPIKGKTTHDLECVDRKYIQNHQEIQASPHHRGDWFGYNHRQIPCSKKVLGKSHQSFRDEAVPYSQKKWEEQKYYLQKRSTADKFSAERGCYQQKKVLPVKERYLYDKEREAWLRRKNESRSLKIIRNNDKFFECRDPVDLMHDKERYMWGRTEDDFLFRKGDPIYECRHSNDFILDKYQRPIVFTERSRYFGAESYQSHQTCTGREDFGRRQSCIGMSSSDDDYHDDYRSYIDNLKPDGGKWRNMPTRDELCDSKSDVLYGRSKRQLCSAEGSKVQFDASISIDAYNRDDRIGYSTNDRVNFGKRSYVHETKELSWDRNGSICCHQDNDFFPPAPIYFQKHSKQEMDYGKHRSNSKKLLDRYKYKMPGEASSNGRSSNVVFRDKHEQSVLRCRDPVDLVVGEGKSSGRRLMHNDKFSAEPMDDIKEHNRSQIRETESEHNGEKWLNKFPVTEYNEDLDLEEGQIIEPEPEPDTDIIMFERRKAPEIEGTMKKMKKCGDGRSHRIHEMRLKMEKREERFKNNNVMVKGSSRISMIPAETCEKKQRPVRKRRWVE